MLNSQKKPPQPKKQTPSSKKPSSTKNPTLQSASVPNYLSSSGINQKNEKEEEEEENEKEEEIIEQQNKSKKEEEKGIEKEVSNSTQSFFQIDSLVELLLTEEEVVLPTSVGIFFSLHFTMFY